MSSPRNHDASMIQGQQDGEICYCCQDWNVEGVSKKDIVWVSCSTCHGWWHVICAGLTGMTKATVLKLKNWNCHFCFVVPDHLKKAKLLNDVAKELTSVIQDAVKVSVVDSIQSVLVNNVVAEANHEVKKSWAKIASGEQEKLMTDVVQLTTGHALSASMQQIDANMQARMKRVRNITVSNLPDNGKDKESVEELKQLICDHAGDISVEEIASAKRIGTFNSVNRNKFRGRVVIAVLKSENKAASMHHYGNGYVYRGASFKEDVWVNPDLIKADRDTKWMAREKRKVEANKDKEIEKKKPVVAPKPEGYRVRPRSVYKQTPVANAEAEVKNTNEEQLKRLEDVIESIEENLPVEENVKSKSDMDEIDVDKGKKVDEVDDSKKGSKN